jgi:hypothetical protein
VAVPPCHAREQDDDRGDRMDREEHEPSERRYRRDDRQEEPFQNVRLAPTRNTRGGTMLAGCVKPERLWLLLP